MLTTPDVDMSRITRDSGQMKLPTDGKQQSWIYALPVLHIGASSNATDAMPDV